MMCLSITPNVRGLALCHSYNPNHRINRHSAKPLLAFRLFVKLKNTYKMKIEDQTINFPFCFNKANDMLLEFFVCKTNELNPYREIKELGIVIYEKDKEKRKSNEYRQLDNMNEFGVDEIEKLIKYLQKAKKHIKTFNENSKPS